MSDRNITGSISSPPQSIATEEEIGIRDDGTKTVDMGAVGQVSVVNAPIVDQSLLPQPR